MTGKFFWFAINVLNNTLFNETNYVTDYFMVKNAFC